jgi:branched-subunit amino acid transport protein
VSTDLAPATVWLVIVLAAVGTFALRLSFLALVGRVESVPPAVEGVLRFVPAAVLAALVVPAVVALSLDPGPALDYEPTRVVAAGVAAVVAWRTESVLATIAAGMAVLWTLQLLL